MRTLLQRNTRYLLTWLPVVLLMCSFIFYILMKMQAHHMQEKQLQLKQSNIWAVFLKNNGNIERSVPGEYEISKETFNALTLANEPMDTSIYLSQKGQLLPFQLLSAHFKWNDGIYRVSTYVSSTEISHLIIKVFITEAVILGLLLLSIVILNKKSSQLLWRPFFSTLKQVNEYDIIQNQSLQLPPETGTTEFNELNKVFTDLINKVNTAYYNQKQFVENASHEMQTPLAIIRSKLELLINQPHLNEKVASQLADITEANDRLSQMNRTLLLLAKIENHQFPDTQAIDFSTLLRMDVSTLKAHYDDNFPELTMNIADNVILNANNSLIEILVHNLLNNAVEHNIQQGKLSIFLTSEKFIIENTGPPLTRPTEELFERFRKGSHMSKTTGLGLALVKQICILYNYSIIYDYTNGLHSIAVYFK